ncbi:hypothetical protein GDO78_011924 [Eleutherodactylus coqui]|uniref:Uncharacterized protein n=1 Tax=Eleutherodactylus coqui TaxID=57060 RepID=A0A8J6F492_ELECQ|nr:hypothetical protein GDO78_011924 [Eleutherodactylus coqui]
MKVSVSPLTISYSISPLGPSSGSKAATVVRTEPMTREGSAANAFCVTNVGTLSFRSFTNIVTFFRAYFLVSVGTAWSLALTVSSKRLENSRSISALVKITPRTSSITK